MSSFLRSLWGLRKLRKISAGQISGFSTDTVTARKKFYAGLLVGVGVSGYFCKTKDKANTIFAHCSECDPEKECVEHQCEERECLHFNENEERLIKKANNELEEALKDVKPKAVVATENALKAFTNTGKSVQKYLDLGYEAIEDELGNSEVWCDLHVAAVERCAMMKDLKLKANYAWQMLSLLKEVIEDGKVCKFTKGNPLLLTAEAMLTCAFAELQNADDKLENIQARTKLVEEYKEMVEDFRNNLKNGQTDLPKDCEDNDHQSKCPCSLIIDAALKSAMQAHKKLAQVQVCQKAPKTTDKTQC